MVRLQLIMTTRIHVAVQKSNKLDALFTHPEFCHMELIVITTMWLVRPIISSLSLFLYLLTTLCSTAECMFVNVYVQSSLSCHLVLGVGSCDPTVARLHVSNKHSNPRKDKTSAGLKSQNSKALNPPPNFPQLMDIRKIVQIIVTWFFTALTALPLWLMQVNLMMTN